MNASKKSRDPNSYSAVNDFWLRLLCVCHFFIVENKYCQYDFLAKKGNVHQKFGSKSQKSLKKHFFLENYLSIGAIANALTLKLWLWGISETLKSTISIWIFSHSSLLLHNLPRWMVFGDPSTSHLAGCFYPTYFVYGWPQFWSPQIFFENLMT